MRLRSFLPVLALLVTACGEGRLVATFEESFTLDDARELLLDNGEGDLGIVGEDDRTDVTLFVELRSHRASEFDDDDAKDAVVLDVRPLDDASAQLVASLHDAPPGYEIDVTAFVPPDAWMGVDDDSGDVHIEAIAGLELHDDSGDIHVNDVSEDVSVSDDSGDIAISSVGGTVTIRDGSGDIFVGGAADVRIESDGSGDVRID